MSDRSGGWDDVARRLAHDRKLYAAEAECPAGGPRCPDAICDCFIDTHPDDPGGLHPEAFVVGGDE